MLFRSFRHGTHPEEYKEFTSHLPVQRMPFVSSYVVPLSQHIGYPSIPIVSKGQYVKRGQMIAQPGGFISVAQHAPVSGTVVEICHSAHPNGQWVPSIIIETDSFSTQRCDAVVSTEWRRLSPQEFAQQVQAAGIVGLGGAAFPSHVKFTLPEGKQCDTLIINGCECEPYLTADHRTMLEEPIKMIRAIEMLTHFLQVEKTFIGVEVNKLDAIDVLNAALQENGLNAEVVPLQVKYPQGAEKMLITAITGREVPAGQLPLDVGTIVSNVGTLVALYNWFYKHQPLIERVVTVTGPGIQRPANLMVPIGTPLNEVLEYCGGLKNAADRVILGGPMMGLPQKHDRSPVIKGTSGVLVLTPNDVHELTRHQCVRCGRCLEACPVYLNPSRLGILAKKGLYEEMRQDEHLMDCMECGCCAFVCPSGIPLVQNFRVAKSYLRQQKVKA